MMKWLLINAGLLLGAALGHAALIQRFDATVAASITTNASGMVTAWNDLSGAGKAMFFGGASAASSQRK